MLPLYDSLPDHLHDGLQLLDRHDNHALDEFELGRYALLQLSHGVLVVVDIVERMRSLGVLGVQIELARDGTEDDGEVLRKLGAGGKELCGEVCE